MKRNKYEIRGICGDWALDIRRGADTITLFFNSRNNAEPVKAIFEWEDAHPNEAAPYTFPSPNDWISVKDRLPEEEVPVIINYIGIRSRRPHPDGVAVIIRNRWYWWEGTVCDSYRGVEPEITHWMPLPEPPKEAKG